MGLSLNALVEAYMRSRGWLGGNVERRLGPITRDFLGFADSVWISRLPMPPPLPGTVRVVAVQHTSGRGPKTSGHLGERIEKIRRSSLARAWLEQGGEIWVIAVHRGRAGAIEWEVVAVELAGRAARPS